jgi:hypothetical protein
MKRSIIVGAVAAVAAGIVALALGAIGSPDVGNNQESVNSYVHNLGANNGHRIFP